MIGAINNTPAFKGKIKITENTEKSKVVVERETPPEEDDVMRSVMGYVMKKTFDEARGVNPFEANMLDAMFTCFTKHPVSMRTTKDIYLNGECDKVSNEMNLYSDQKHNETQGTSVGIYNLEA